MVEDQHDLETADDGLHAQLEAGAEAQLANYRDRLGQVLAAFQQERDGFQRYLTALCGEAFHHYDACYSFAVSIGNGLNERYRVEAHSRQDRVYEVLVRLHSLACLTASEVRALVFTGHGGGALALSRRALELAIIGNFIRERGGDVAERYIKHAPYERWKWANQYSASAIALGEPVQNPGELRRLRERCDELAREYDENYLNDYGWAANALRPNNPRYRPTFRDIMEATNLRQVRHFYLVASQRVHAGATGSAAHIQATPHGGAYLTGPGDTGLALPASATLRALVQCTGEFATHALAAYEERPEPVVQFMTLRRLVNQAGSAFDAVETKVAKTQREQGLRQ